MSLPNRAVIEPRLGLLVIGAGKAGTTSLHGWLDQHPDIHMSKPVKEAEYFFPRDRMHYSRNAPPPPRNRNMRLNMLAGYRGQPLFGESSPAYSCEAVETDNPVPAAARAHNPAMRIVYTLRNPYARILSNVRQDIHSGRLSRGTASVPDALMSWYLSVSLYARHLAHWRAVFPDRQIKVMLLEEYGRNPPPAMNDLAAFLGLAPFPPDTIFAPANVTARRAIRPPEVRFSPAQFAALRPRIERDVALLGEYIGRDLGEVWDLSAAKWVDEKAGGAGTEARNGG